ASLAQAVWDHGRLPVKVASHFDAAGVPNGWMSREVFTAFHVGVVLFLAVAMSTSAAGIASGRRGRINIPHRDYWLAPERLPSTLAALADWLYWFGAGTYVLLIDVFEQVLRFNRGFTMKLGHPLLSLSAYGVFAVWWTVRLMRRFSRVPA
ncbi:MAG: DUF1648 domain-containing protein, partial [Elusimicrobia bacterium]|nr:DUF1648 domain-containing protein [Elusimicrobiota bacterium]